MNHTTGNTWQRIRKQVLERDGYICQECGCFVSLQMGGAAPTAHVHHLTPRDEGGSDDSENLQTLCKNCHGVKHDGKVMPDADDTSKFGSQLEKHPNWKGGQTVTSHGYVMVKAPDHPDAHANGYVYEHRLVAEQKLGRRITSEEHVHHQNSDKQDNRPENLEVLHNTEHRVKHRNGGNRKRLPGEPNPVIECGCGCGETFRKYDKWNRPRERLPGHTEYSRATPAKDDIMKVLRRDSPIHRRELADAVNRPLNGVSTHLSQLRNDDRAAPIGGGEWVIADAPEADGYERETPAQDAVLALLRENGPMHRDDLADQLNRSVKTVPGILSRLQKSDAVERVAKGVWKAAGESVDDPIKSLYPSKANIVRTLRSDGPMKRDVLADAVGLSRGTIGQHLSDLKDRGLVESAGWGKWDATSSHLSNDG